MEIGVFVFSLDIDINHSGSCQFQKKFAHTILAKVPYEISTEVTEFI